MNSYTKNSITLSINGTFAATTTGDQSGWIAIKNNWSGSHVHTEWFSSTPTVTATNLVIGGIHYTPSTVFIGNSDSYAFGDCLYIENTTQSTPFAAGTVVSGSITLTLASGSFTNNVSLNLVSGFEQYDE